MELSSFTPVSDAVRSGDRRASLTAIRDHLAARLETAPPRDVAAIARQLSDTIEQLENMPKEKGASIVDQLAAKREARRTGTED